MRYADLHTHTTHSDGTRSSKEVIDVARAAGIEIVAISDHDNLAAFFEIKRYADEQGVLLIPAAELSCGFEGIDIHVLAYAFDPHDEAIAARLQHFRESRLLRGHRMIERLQSLGYSITRERVEQLSAGGAMGRPHIARALVEGGFTPSVSAAFKTMLGPGKPAYVEKERFQIEEALALIHSAGGVTSIAHPTLYPGHERVVPLLLDAGLDGIEVFHPEVSEGWCRQYSNIARFRGKMLTGGSDDHGTVKKEETLGTIKVPETLLAPILERM